MTPDEECQVTGGTNPGTFTYDQMLSQSPSGSVVGLVVISCIAGLLALFGGWLLYSTWRLARIRR
jgi:hypothetical protein